MVRIGVFIDTFKGTIPASFREKMRAHLQGLSNVVFCIEDQDLSSPEGRKRMAEVLEPEKVDRLIIFGGNPKLYESSFSKCAIPIPLNPYLFSVADIREEALSEMADEERAWEKTKTMIAKTIRLATVSKPIETQFLPLKSEVLVIGGGLVGMSIAETLVQSNIRVTLLEKEKSLGGKAQQIRWLYNGPQEVDLWIKKKSAQVIEMPDITVLTQSTLKGLWGHLGGFQAKIERYDGTEISLFPSVIVVATGYATERETKGIYGHKRMISLTQMENLIAGEEDFSLVWEGKKVETVTFLLDGVNEDLKVDSINAMKQALVLQENLGCQVSILCKEAKVAADGMERLYRKVREKGVVFFKYEEAPRLSMVDGQIQVDVRDTSAIRREERQTISILSDLVVVSEASIPNPETETLRALLKLHLGARGFFMEDNPQLLRLRSNRRGIFVAGACRFPQETSESLIEARAVAQEVIALLSQGIYTYDLAVAEVDPKKCAVCYTCPRLCPHSAITIERYAQNNVYATSGVGEEMKWGAAKVNPVACYGCGICVAECPGKAITLHHLPDEQIYIQMGLTS